MKDKNLPPPRPNGDFEATSIEEGYLRSSSKQSSHILLSLFGQNHKPFNKVNQSDLGSGHSEASDSSTTIKPAEVMTSENKNSDSFIQHPFYQSPLRLQPVIPPSDEELLEFLMGRVQHVNNLGGVDCKEMLFKQIIELLSKKPHLLNYQSKYYDKRTAIELAMDLNQSRGLDHIVKTLAGMGCYYRPQYEMKLQVTLRQSKDTLFPEENRDHLHYLKPSF